MSTGKKHLSQFIPTENRHDPARKHQIVFPGLMDADLEFVGAKPKQLLERLEARLPQNLYDVIDIVRKRADRAPSK